MGRILNPLKESCAKVRRVSSKKLDEVLAHQKPFFDKSGLGYTGESSSSTIMSKEMKFVKAKEPVVATLAAKKVKFEKKPKVITQRAVTKPPNPAVATQSKRKISSEVTKRTTNSALLPPLWNPRTH